MAGHPRSPDRAANPRIDRAAAPNFFHQPRTCPWFDALRGRFTGHSAQNSATPLLTPGEAYGRGVRPGVATDAFTLACGIRLRIARAGTCLASPSSSATA